MVCTSHGGLFITCQAGTSGAGFAYIFAAAARGDGSVVLGGTVVGSFAKVFAGGSDTSDFIAVAMDEDGNELWRWQVRVVPAISIPRDLCS